MIASKIGQQVSKNINKAQVQVVCQRLQSTSTMALYGNTPCVERDTTLSETQLGVNINTNTTNSNEMKKDFSTLIQYDDLPETNRGSSMLRNSNDGAAVATSTAPVAVGFEITPEQAIAHARPGPNSFFDKIMILISHGETTEGCHPTDVNAPLTGKGIGSALRVSGEIAKYCNRKTGLVPDLYVVSPARCTIESALLSFPNYAPGNIHNRPWICHDQCADADLGANAVRSDVSYIHKLETDFPGVDCDILKQSRSDSTSDFMSWLNERDDRIIVVSSTESWVDSFFDTYVPTESRDEDTKKRKLFRTVGVKYH